MDRMSMAHSLEGRVPFLDVPLVEWGLAVPSPLKLGHRSNKRVVKRVADELLSPQVVRGPKSGFGLPLGDWFRSGSLHDVRNRVRDPGHPAAELFEPRYLARVLQEHDRGQRDRGELLWLLANVYLWVELEREASAGRPPGPLRAA
jgi:asparagine synthase (glutamine-hydrolysing)